MAYSEKEARELVIQAGKRLLETGLIARTWGNVSARISDTQFVITPSGKPYDTLTEDNLVTVNTADCSYEGVFKRSSEKGIHADAYRLRPEVNFVIHTHQLRASVVGASGISIDEVPDEYKDILGCCVPVADYGMPSTDKLRKAVESVYNNYLSSKAFLMKHHGAVCLGIDYEDAFEVAETLEVVCKQKVHKAYRLYEGTTDYSRKAMLASFIKAKGGGTLPSFVTDFGESFRIGNIFEIEYKNGKKFTVDIKTGKSDSEEELPRSAMVHNEIYKSSDVSCIRHLTENEIVGYSVTGNPINPMLDDFAQIAGAKINCCPWDGSKSGAKSIARAVKGKNVVLINGLGAICTGNKYSDLEAVELVLSKECHSHMGSVFFGKGENLSPIDCNIMRTIYLT
ncbi:MAG: class II aldolase/adducin family protein, partial [Ruminococcus sp.]|nr:class II aldolase/adducin family protein [Candidatus Copronaster equi]